MKEPSVTVVVNTVDRAAHLKRTLEGLRQQRYRNFEVVVVNGPSTDDTAGTILSSGIRVKVARCPDRNLCLSRNIGISFAAGEVVAFVDDDAVPEPYWLDRLVVPFVDAGVGVVGGPLLDHTGTSWQVRFSLCDRMGRARHPETLTDDDLRADPERDWYPAPTGANSSFRRSALVEAGGFDENLEWYLDETDLTLRLMDAGWRYAYADGAVVHHKYAPSHLRTNDRKPKSLRQPLFSIAYFAMTHGRDRYGTDRAIRRVADEVQRRTSEVGFMRLTGAIPRDDCARLVREIIEGAKAGVRAAMSGPPRCRKDLAWPLAPFSPAMEAKRARPLRICLVSQDYPPGKVGGIGIWTESLATALAARGNEVTVVCRGASHTVDFTDGVWVHRIVPSRRDVGLMGDVPRPLADHSNSVADEVRRVASSRGLDVVSAPIWDLEGEAIRRSGILPVVTSLHTTYRMSLPSKPEWTRHADYFESHVSPIMDAEDRIVREAKLLANSLAIVRDVFEGIGEPVDEARVRLVAHGAADPGTVDCAGSKGVSLLFVGRLERRKGIDVLIAAADEVLRERPFVDLTVVGDETGDFDRPWEGTVRAMREAKPHMARVAFVGFVTREELRNRYAACDVFVAPSRYESFGLIYLEAMALGKPCVGAFAGGIAEVVSHGETGLLSIPGDPASLATCIARLVDDPVLRATMGAAGRRRYEAHFTTAVMAERAEGVYREAAERVDDEESAYGRGGESEGTALVGGAIHDG